MSATPAKRLVLIRHATPEAGRGGPDPDRHLVPQGVEEATALGAYLKNEGLLGMLVLCSPAIRTRETWAAIVEATGHGVVVQIEPSIYEAGSDDLVELLRTVSDDVATLTLVGHAPGVPALAFDLCSDGGGSSSTLRDETAWQRLNRGFPPATVAVVNVHVPWADIASGTGVLERVVWPEDLQD